ncbi:MAG TPA: DUF2330 domain-containing protein [Xanthobacteraceae bacterium]
MTAKRIKTRTRLKSTVAIVAIAAQLLWQVGPAAAFCGFYVAKADTKLFNTTSKVVLARDGDKTTITMASDYEGEPREFALVVPVPTFIERKQIGVVEMKTIDHIDAYTAPRLVEYFDQDPCVPTSLYFAAPASQGMRRGHLAKAEDHVSYGVTVEASYDVGEYDVQILSATQSNGLATWLTDNGYRIPPGANGVLASYIKQGMHFFVAKVDLDRMQQIGRGYLRPLQVRYESAKFMLPLRLGTVNANGPQDLIIYALGRNGRVETTNYRTIKMPSAVNVPLYVKEDFGKVYKAAFERAVRDEDMRAVFTEYAWDMRWCDPCAGAPMSASELVELGARWMASDSTTPAGPASASAFVTRLHVRYDAAHFPEDLALMETHDRDNYQVRYVLNHPWQGVASCWRAWEYRKGLPARFDDEAKNLAALTGWAVADIKKRMADTGETIQGR